MRFRDTVLPGGQALRLVYGEADQLPGLVVDRYGDTLAVQILTLGIETRADLVREALEHVLRPKGAVRMADSPLRTLEGLSLSREVWWGEVPEKVEVAIEGFRVEADLIHGQKTGLFLDQRLNRRVAEAHAKDRRVLDLFCYQGEWALHAARGGAREVVGVDSSEPALAAAARNLERNGLEGRVSFRRGDAFDVARELQRAGERFGLVILDPPALVRSRKHLAEGARAYRELNRAAMGSSAARAATTSGTCCSTRSCSRPRAPRAARSACSSGAASRPTIRSSSPCPRPTTSSARCCRRCERARPGAGRLAAATGIR